MKGALCTRLSRLESSAEMAIACSAVNPPASSPIEQISQLQDSTLAILRRAQATGRTDTALRVIREARSNMEFMARLTGDPKEVAVRAVVMLPQAASTNNDFSMGVELDIRR